MKWVRMFLAVSLLLVVAASCNRPAREEGPRKLKVVATLFPLYDFARQIGGDKVEVQLLLPPGLEPHNFEPRPDDMIRIHRADLFIFTNKFMEPWAEKLLQGIKSDTLEVVDAGQGATFLPVTESAEEHHDHGSATAGGPGYDPHIWLDVANARIMVDTIAAGFARKDPANAEFYKANAASYGARLAKLDERFRTGLSRCQTRIFMHGGHYAFGYLAKAYGLNYSSTYSAVANAEPSPRKLVDLVKKMRQDGVRAIFYEELISPAMAEMIARETGARLVKLHGLHNIGKGELEKGASYLSLMEQNLENLRKGLECR